MKAPGFGDSRKAMLDDIAVLTGGSGFTEELDVKLDKATPDMFGRAKVTIEKENTTIVNGDGDKSAIQARFEQIRAHSTPPPRTTTAPSSRSGLPSSRAGSR